MISGICAKVIGQLESYLIDILSTKSDFQEYVKTIKDICLLADIFASLPGDLGRRSHPIIFSCMEELAPDFKFQVLVRSKTLEPFICIIQRIAQNSLQYQ